ncbi:uncharacterized protein LOC116802063 [Drosophila sechellia]|uniref:uncharacterized protein LOC116802063 n=1 Tax=Drosophila sechellia TaxID=7238 RepID=UPI0013DE2BD9|nr:uncharacterized protein LOC116802063 [Drosophila sechellia]
MDFNKLKKMEEAAALAMLPLKDLSEIQEMTIKFTVSSEWSFVRKSSTAGPSKVAKSPKVPETPKAPKAAKAPMPPKAPMLSTAHIPPKAHKAPMPSKAPKAPKVR